VIIGHACAQQCAVITEPDSSDRNCYRSTTPSQRPTTVIERRIAKSHLQCCLSGNIRQWLKIKLYRSMGNPAHPTMKQISELNQTSALKAPEQYRLKVGNLDLSIPVNGLALMEITNWK
jgi:hypothetical protein